MAHKKIEYYQIVPVFEANEDVGKLQIVNASVGICGLCGGAATGMGGSDDQLCVRCAEVVICGQARGAIVWESD